LGRRAGLFVVPRGLFETTGTLGRRDVRPDVVVAARAGGAAPPLVAELGEDAAHAEGHARVLARRLDAAVQDRLAKIGRDRDADRDADRDPDLEPGEPWGRAALGVRASFGSRSCRIPSCGRLYTALENSATWCCSAGPRLS